MPHHSSRRGCRSFNQSREHKTSLPKPLTNTLASKMSGLHVQDLKGVEVSAGQWCDLRMRPVHVASRTAIYGFSTITDDATALR